MNEPVDTKEGTPASISHVRLIAIMGLVAVAGTVIGFAFFSVKAGAGFAIGGVLSIVNYYWMKHSLRKIFENTEEGVKPKFAGSNYVMRYVAFATLIAFIYLIDWHLLVPVILGLTSFAFAVVIEGFIRIFTTFGNKEGI
ncbi:MAG: ATP synthase subunit I [Acidobacteria bacterium]|nr:MAG: ATP synthase subunit I [Acidobacteriota bacterium]REK03924.1 MAG: ATP synthase subunit I [Acidobacteriota bacterium]REK15086.1 MAG: ATP synthase subunit I [Acidobacteriota bacterium]REK46176.1 MAG: ATP synthase subunit I [Acidobacteriota bacterium]